jgi:hypothetical protein
VCQGGLVRESKGLRREKKVRMRERKACSHVAMPRVPDEAAALVLHALNNSCFSCSKPIW